MLSQWFTSNTQSDLNLDGAYSGEKFACAIKKAIGATVEVVKRSELHSFKVVPKRWVVGWSFAWLEGPVAK